MMDVSLYLVETFTPHVGTDFTATPPDGQPFPLRLTEVQPGQSNERVLQFSLLFRGPLTPSLPQNTYHLAHERLGEMDFFLVPVAREADGMIYQAVFSRFRGAVPTKP